MQGLGYGSTQRDLLTRQKPTPGISQNKCISSANQAAKEKQPFKADQTSLGHLEEGRPLIDLATAPSVRCALRAQGSHFIRNDPYLNPIRNHPRYIALWNKLAAADSRR